MVFIFCIFYMYILKCGLQPMNHETAQRPDQSGAFALIIQAIIED